MEQAIRVEEKIRVTKALKGRSTYGNKGGGPRTGQSRGPLFSAKQGGTCYTVRLGWDNKRPKLQCNNKGSIGYQCWHLELSVPLTHDEAGEEEEDNRGQWRICGQPQLLPPTKSLNSVVGLTIPKTMKIDGEN